MFSVLFPERFRLVIATLALLLQGCGHKGPLQLPAPQTQPTMAQNRGSQIPESPQPALPTSQQGK
ncbi:MAG: lipoprotein [Pseudomonadota bacterium]